MKKIKKEEKFVITKFNGKKRVTKVIIIRK
jgi:hypothetical protein